MTLSIYEIIERFRINKIINEKENLLLSNIRLLVSLDNSKKTYKVLRKNEKKIGIILKKIEEQK